MAKLDPRTKDQLRAEIRRLERELAALPRKVEFAFTTDLHEIALDGWKRAEPGARWIDLYVELRDGTAWKVHTPVVPGKTTVERFTQEP